MVRLVKKGSVSHPQLPTLSGLTEILARCAYGLGDEFFGALTQAVAEILSLDCVLVAFMDHDKPEDPIMRTRSVWFRDRHMPNFDYALRGTPCEQVMDAQPCVFPCGVQEEFPEDVMLVEMQMVCYAGSTVRDRSGQPIGVVAALDRNPLPEAAAYREFMLSLAALVSGELERAATLDAVAEARAQAEEANETKARFLASLSHDVRTPLNGVLGSCDLLLGTRLEEGQSDLVMTIAHSGRFLLSQFEQILDFARLDKASVTIRNATLRPSDLAEDLRLLFAGRMAKRRLKFACLIDGDACESWITTDQDRILQIMSNLVQNALKFTECGFVHVYVHANRVGERVELVLEVEDSGPGVASDERENVFLPFSQLDNVDQDPLQKGVGLGLSACRRVATVIDATVECVEPRQPSGALFRLRLECDPAPAPVAGDPTGDDRPGGMRVLLAEDNQVNQRVAMAMLDALGCEAILAEDGDQAVAMGTSQPFDLILMDYQMPGRDGAEAARAIREAGLDVPIVAVTAHALSGYEDRCREAGMDGFVTKPLRKDRLREVLLEYRRQKKQSTDE